MQPLSESHTTPLPALHDVGMLVLCALGLVPLYLLLNHYWQSLVLLVGLYGFLGFFCLRVGGYIRRVMRRWPAEMPPWHDVTLAPVAMSVSETHCSAVDTLHHVRCDPHYVQEVLKPRLLRLLQYRLTGRTDPPEAPADLAALALRDPILAAFFQGQEPTHLWATYCGRQRRVDTLLDVLQRLEAL